MIMKITKHIFIMLSSILLVAVLTGCSAYDEDIYGSFPYLEIDETDISLSKLEGVVHIPYESNRTVKVKSNSNWLNVSADQEEIVLRYKANDLEEIRKATVEITAPNSLVKKSIDVAQDASGELTIQTDLILRSKTEIQKNTYTKTTGALIIGNVTSVKTKATSVALGETRASDTKVTVENNNYTFISSPTDINDADIDPLKEQIHMIKNGVLAIQNTEVKNLPVDLIKSNKVNKIYFDYNEMTELPSKSDIDAMGLTELSIIGNKVSDIFVLKGNSTISYLDISGNDVYNLDALFDMPKLKKVVLNNLPLTKPQVEVFKEKFTKCEVVLESFRPESSPLPILEGVEIEQISDTKVKLTATISKNKEGIKEVGFYIGGKRYLADMEFHPSTYSDGKFTLTYTTAELYNKIYYVRAYAKSSLGNGYSDVTNFGSLTADGDIVLNSIDALNKFYADCYSHVNGSVLIGKITNSGTNGIKLDFGGKSYIFAKSTDMSDLSAISSLVFVRDGLYIGNIGIENLDAIANISGIQTLWLKGNNISKIPTLESNNTITSLDVSINQLENFNFLEDMPSLKRLALGAADAPKNETNKIGALTGLEKYTNLEYIDLSGLPIHQWQVDELRGLMPATEIVFTSGGRTPYIPAVATKKMSKTETSITLTAVVTSKGNDKITEYGFYYGKDLSNMTQVKVGDSIEPQVTFSHTLDISDLDTYYYYPYAKNKYGESRIEASKFSFANIDLSQGGTANCYIVYPVQGSYTFDLVKGNSSEPVGEVSSVEVLWETYNNASVVKAGSVISSVILKGDQVQFEIPEDAVSGNALIAAKDANGTILWSWHIWVVDYDPVQTQQTYISGAVMMDRNLGALRSTPYDSTVNGMFYQWGRKDPLLGTYNATTFITTYPANVKQYTNSEAAKSVDYTIKNPTTVVAYLKNPDGSWATTKTIYDPCPAGWRVPDGGPGVWAGIDTHTTIDTGYYLEPPYSEPRAYYPGTGYTDGTLTFYWYNAVYSLSCTPIGSDSFYSLHLFGESHQISRKSGRSAEHTVRCMKDHGVIITIDNIKAYSDRAVVTANVRSTLSAYVSERGFVFSAEDADLTINNSTVVKAGVGEGNYSATLTDLKPNTNYWVRAYVVVNGAVEYGTVIDFKTLVKGSGDDFTEDDYEWE